MQTSGGLRRENAKSYPRRMGRAEAKPIGTPTGIDGYRVAPPILQRGPRSGRLEGEGTGRDHFREPGTRTPVPVTARPALISGSRISLW
jgi:hypothetical protein